MSIKPPMCKQCGHSHWGLDHVYEGRQTTHPLAAMPMMEREPVPRSVAPSKLKAMEAELEAAHAEIAMLKRKLAEKAVTKTSDNNVTNNVTVTKTLDNNVTAGKRGRPPVGDKPMTKAERTRKWRKTK